MHLRNLLVFAAFVAVAPLSAHEPEAAPGDAPDSDCPYERAAALAAAQSGQAPQVVVIDKVPDGSLLDSRNEKPAIFP